MKKNFKHKRAVGRGAMFFLGIKKPAISSGLWNMLHMAGSLMAEHMGIEKRAQCAMMKSVSAVRNWEVGEKHPGGLALKLINVLDRKGMEALV